MVNSQRFPFIHGTCLATVEAQRAAPPAGVKDVPSHPSQKVAEYEINRGVCEGYKRKSDMGIFSKIHAYVLIKTRREFINLRRLLMNIRRLFIKSWRILIKSRRILASGL